MSKTYHHGDLRSALLTAAEAVLERDGITALTLRAAAREAGVSHAAPTHHFGDMTGLLTELAASGFVRFREHMQTDYELSGVNSQIRLIALGHRYVDFAKKHPGLFQLMFRSEKLDWSVPALYEAGDAAFALLAQPEDEPATSDPSQNFQRLVKATARWSSMHGLATLLVDGRLEPTSQKVPGSTMDALIDAVIKTTLGVNSQE